MGIFGKTAAVFALLASSGIAMAQSGDLNNRVDALERKMDTILKLLQDRQPAAQSSAPPAQERGQPEGFVPGLYMDVYAPLDKTLWDAEFQREMPIGIPAASVAISPSSTLSYGELLKHDETKDFATRNRVLPAVVFRGYIQIAERGRHAIGVNFKSTVQNCLLQLQLNGKSIINKAVRGKPFYSNIPQLDLAPGFYKMDLFLECDNVSGDFPFSEQNMTMMLAAPNDRAPSTAPASLFFIKQ